MVLGWLSEPFESDVVQRALLAGALVACLCALVGTWVVLRGAAFLGDAMSHGVLPGVAAASLLGGNIFVGAMVAALAMAYGVTAINRSSRLSSDTSIGLLLVGMLAAGVIIVSHSQSYAVDLTGFLFGDVLAVRTHEIAILAGAVTLTATAVFVGRRAFVAATFDSRKAATLGLRPELAAAVLTVLIAIAVVASFRVVGTLLVFGLLIAPPAAAAIWGNTIPQIMVTAAVIGVASVAIGLVVSWHAASAGGATIAAVAVGFFFCSLTTVALRRHLGKAAVLFTAAACLTACGGGGDTAVTSTSPADHDATPPSGVEESAEPVTRLVIVDPGTGDTAVYDVLDQNETGLGRFGRVERLSGDGRFGYLHRADSVTIVDSGSWTFDHGDHNHYYLAPPTEVGTLKTPGDQVAADQDVVAISLREGRVELLDRDLLGQRQIAAPDTDTDTERLGDIAQAVPLQDGLLVVTESGQLMTIDEKGSASGISGECTAVTGAVSIRRSVILSCAGGAVRVSVTAGETSVTPIPLPTEEALALGELRRRDGSRQLAGIAGDEVWVLDTGPRTWSVVPSPGAVAASTGDGGEVLILTNDGVLRAVDITTGAETGSLRLFTDGVAVEAPAPVIEVDRDRAYVNNGSAREIYEIDYGDELRIARTLTTGVEPGLMVKAGR